MRLNDKVAVITGSTRGIGRGIAEAFLEEGARVVLNGRTPAKGEAALAELGRRERAHFISGDVTQEAGVRSVVEGAVERFGRLDIVVNNAGGSLALSPIVDLETEDWNHTILWNLSSTFWGARYALRHMIPQRSGRIINLSSVEGKHGKPGISAYVAAKHAINGFTKSTAKEVGTLGITVNAICPGLVPTDALTENGPAAATAMGLTLDELIAQYAAESATRRTNTVEEVAAVAVLLASDAGAGITGALLSVDGGTAAY